MDLQQMKNIKIGEVLKSSGYITEGQLEAALARQKKDRSKRLAEIMIDMGFITEEQKLDALGKRLNMQVIELDSFSVDSTAVEKIPKTLAVKYKMVAIGYMHGKLLVAVNDPVNFFAIEDIRQSIGMPLELCLARLDQIERAIEYYYSEVLAKQASSEANITMRQYQQPETERITPDGVEDAPVVKLLDSLLVRGYNTNASDIHIEPFEDRINVRIRVDGMIVNFVTLSTNLQQPLIARIKILSNLDIAEKRAPQDGHFKMRINDQDVNLRVSVVPTVYGEKAVLRFLNSNTKIDNDDSFGMNQESYEKMMRILRSPHGIIYITGPTGSGKTTTLYMILQYLAQHKVNISTIEDPVERNLDKINQIQVAPLAGLTFGTGLRAILRQDPDIIMVGETRDTETAEISVRAAITGHLVMSTLHTNDAVSSIVRLEDMGIPQHLLASSLVGLVAQRLVKKNCPYCTYEYQPDETEQKILGRPVDRLWRGKGCHMCNQTGYRGRTAVHEILLVDQNVRRMITKGASVDEISEYAIDQQGMKTLWQSTINLVLSGETTVDELMKNMYYL